MTHKTPSLRQELDQLTELQQLPILLIMFAFWIVCAVEWTQRLSGEIPDPRFWSLLSLVITAYAGWQVFRLHARIRPAKAAARAEHEVACILDQIRGKGFVAFHDLPGTKRNIDHVVVGPGGIYAIETKQRSGSGTIDYRSDQELVFGGRIKDGFPLQHARESALSVQSRLRQMLNEPCSVKPLVVFLGDWDIQNHDEEKFPVDVVTADKLVDYFERQPAELTPEEICAISSCFDEAAAA